MKRWVLLAVAALLCAPLSARAADALSAQEGAGGKRYTLELNGGLGGYYGTVGDLVNVGPSYGVVAGMNKGPLLTLEGAYLGHTSSINDSTGNLTSNKIQLDAKVGPELNMPVAWRPFLFGGVGLDIVSAGSNRAGLTNAVQGVIPVGIGAEFFTNSKWRVGARGTYDLAPGVGGDVASFQSHPDEWQATLNAQAAF